MHRDIVLASASCIRSELLTRARVPHVVQPARIDEDSVTRSLIAEGAPPRDVADKLAELKALRIAARRPEALVLGADQVLAVDGRLLDKPADPGEALRQLRFLRGRTHRLCTAVVACEDGLPVWRQVSEVRLTMHAGLDDDWLARYVDRNWDSIRWSVGGYRIEEEGPRLFSRVEGDYFSILGLPLIELLSWLTLRGGIPS